MRLSVIVTCTQPWPEVRGCLERLVPQVRAGEIELIVADGSAGGLDAKAAERVRWLRSPDRGPHELRLAGLVEARGDVVAITEDHCDVAPDWCEKMLDAHGRYPDAVAIAGPVTNGAAGRMMDRASFFLVHGRNVPEHGGRPDDWFPPAGSNVSYKREQIICGVQRPGDLKLVRRSCGRKACSGSTKRLSSRTHRGSGSWSTSRTTSIRAGRTRGSWQSAGRLQVEEHSPGTQWRCRGGWSGPPSTSGVRSLATARRSDAWFLP